MHLQPRRVTCSFQSDPSPCIAAPMSFRSYLPPPLPYHAPFHLPTCVSKNTPARAPITMMARPSSASPLQTPAPEVQRPLSASALRRTHSEAHFQRNGPPVPFAFGSSWASPVRSPIIPPWNGPLYGGNVFTPPKAPMISPYDLQRPRSAPVSNHVHAARSIHIFGGALLQPARPLCPTLQQRAWGKGYMHG